MTLLLALLFAISAAGPSGLELPSAGVGEQLEGALDESDDEVTQVVVGPVRAPRLRVATRRPDVSTRTPSDLSAHAASRAPPLRGSHA